MIDNLSSVPGPDDKVTFQASVPVQDNMTDDQPSVQGPEADQFIMMVIPPPPELPNLGFTTLLYIDPKVYVSPKLVKY